MALQPVTGVTPLHTGNVNFGARNRNNDNISEGSPMRIPAGMKAIPVAVLIAMSPLNEVNAVGTALPEPEVTEITSYSAASKPRVIGTYEIKDSNDKIFYEVKKLSLDGNFSDYEALEVIRYNPLNNKVSSRGLVTSGFVGRNNEGKPMVTMRGIPLKKEDLSSYEIEIGVFKELKRSDYNAGAIVELAKFLRQIAKDEANNEAFILYTEPGIERVAKEKDLKNILKQY